MQCSLSFLPCNTKLISWQGKYRNNSKMIYLYSPGPCNSKKCFVLISNVKHYYTFLLYYITLNKQVLDIKGLFIYYVLLFQAFLDPYLPFYHSVSAFGLPPIPPRYNKWIKLHPFLNFTLM